MGGPVIPIISAVLGAASSYRQYESGKEAEKMAKENAKRARAETAEEVRRQQAANAQMEGLAKARAAAGGAKLTGTVSSYLDRLKEENLKDIDWMRRSGASRAGLEQRKGKVAKSQATAGAVGSLAGSASSFYSAGSNANWWS